MGVIDMSFFHGGFRGFTLVELLIASLFIPVTAAGFVSCSRALVETVSYSDDAVTAQERAEHVFSMMEILLAHCGYGLAADAHLTDSFSNVKGYVPFAWGARIAVSNKEPNTYAAKKNGTLLVLYAVPSGIRAIHSVAVSSDTAEIHLSGSPSMLEACGRYSLPLSPKNWALFGASRPFSRPMWCVRFDDRQPSDITIGLKWNKPDNFGGELTIHENDELYYLRAVSCAASHSTLDGESMFSADHCDGSGRQPMETGVVDARFELQSSGKLLKVNLLVRGDRNYGEIKTKGTPDGWPEEYAPDISDANRHFRLFAFSELFEVMN
jgi:Tfp pilus assembly protein PilV